MRPDERMDGNTRKISQSLDAHGVRHMRFQVSSDRHSKALVSGPVNTIAVIKEACDSKNAFQDLITLHRIQLAEKCERLFSGLPIRTGNVPEMHALQKSWRHGDAVIGERLRTGLLAPMHVTRIERDGISS